MRIQILRTLRFAVAALVKSTDMNILKKWQIFVVAISLIGVGFGIWSSKSSEVTAVVTTIYVVLVFIQLQLMQEQHKTAKEMREESTKREAAAAPSLEINNLRVTITTDTNRLRNTELGQAWYVNASIQNMGRTIAKSVQPVVTGFARQLPNGKWDQKEDWIPLELRWALDEINTTQGKPTQDRYLVPKRPYIFDLGKLTIYTPERKFELLVLLKPNVQQCEFAAGQYCFEVSAFCENAEPVRSWFEVSCLNIQSEQPLRVIQLQSPPWMERAT